MGKVAGIFKKLKKIGSELGNKAAKAFAWLNTNLLQPLKPIISNAIDMFDESGTGSRIFNSVSDVYDGYSKKNGDAIVNPGVQQMIDMGRDIFDYTQDPSRYNNKKKYNKPFKVKKEIELDDLYGVDPPMKVRGPDLSWE